MKSIQEYLSYIDSQFGEKTAFQWYDETAGTVQKVSFTRHSRNVRRFASFMADSFGDLTGKHVAILAGNSYEYTLCFLGILLAGGVAVPINSRETWAVQEHQLRFTDVEFAVCDGAFLRLRPEFSETGIKLCRIEDFASADVTVRDFPERDENAPAMILFTSGTTGESKCPVLSLANLLAYAQSQYDFSDKVDSHLTKPSMLFLHMLPMFHIAGNTAFFGVNLLGQTANLCLDMRYLARDMQLMPSTRTVAVPMVMDIWSKKVLAGNTDCLHGISLIVTAGAAASAELVEKFASQGIFMAGMYALSETTGVGLINLFSESRKFASVGVPAKGTQVKIIDGEICLKSATVMLGYYKNPKATAEVIDADGWFHTGDLGRMDEDGYVYLTGRKKNLIILSSGENVNPEELEKLVSQNAAVQEVLVKEKDKKICAEIFCAEKEQAAVRAYINEINRTLPLFKRITLVEFRSSPFPKTSLGKTKRS